MATISVRHLVLRGTCIKMVMEGKLHWNSFSLKCFSFWEMSKTIRCDLTCPNTWWLKTVMGFHYSGDSGDRFSWNFHRFVISCLSLITLSVDTGFWQLPKKHSIYVWKRLWIIFCNLNYHENSLEIWKNWKLQEKSQAFWNKSKKKKYVSFYNLSLTVKNKNKKRKKERLSLTPKCNVQNIMWMDRSCILLKYFLVSFLCVT